MAILLLALAFSFSQTPPAPTLPDSLKPRVPAVDRVWHDSSRGVGYLTSVENLDAFEWLRGAILPLHRAPGEQPFAWLMRGWVSGPGPAGGWHPYTVGGWLGVVYDGPVALIVYESRPDGWFRFRYSAPSRIDGGAAWANASHLALGPTAMKVVTWETHYLKAERPTYFADSARHPLHALPDSSSGVVAWLERGPRGEVGAYGVSPLEVRGDWMRVRVQWPYPVCGKKAERTLEGWIRWKTPSQGLLLGGFMIC